MSSSRRLSRGRRISDPSTSKMARSDHPTSSHRHGPDNSDTRSDGRHSRKSSSAEMDAIQSLLYMASGQAFDETQEDEGKGKAPAISRSVTPRPLANLNDTQNSPQGSVSTAFGPGVPNVDLVLVSLDNVSFHVHYAVLDGISDNAFASTLHEGVAQPVAIPDTSSSLNIILHAIYDVPSAKFSPTIVTLVSAVDRMPYYGLPVQQIVHPSRKIFTLLYSMAPRYPVEIYSLAAHHSLHNLATLASSHLLAYSLHTLMPEMVVKMGSVYLNKLLQLQLNRMSALRDLLTVIPVSAHDNCLANPQRAWAFATLDVTRDARPDISPNLLSASMKAFAEDVDCAICKECFLNALSSATEKWAAVEATIR